MIITNIHTINPTQRFSIIIRVLNDYRSRCDEDNGQPVMKCEENECLTDPNLLETVRLRASQYGWSAQNYSEFWGRKYDEGLNLRLGTLHSTKKVCVRRIFHDFRISNYL